jgi:hypothetical protein
LVDHTRSTSHVEDKILEIRIVVQSLGRSLSQILGPTTWVELL